MLRRCGSDSTLGVRTKHRRIALLEAAGVPCSKYLTLRDTLTDPQYAWRGSFSEVTDSAGSFDVLAPPFQMSG
ncbi:MAG: CoA transferase [Janthinobacterium lividum]